MGLQGWAAQHWYFVRTYPSHIHVVQFGLVWCDKHALMCTYLIIPRKQTKLYGRILHTESLRLNSSQVAFIWNPSLQLMVQYYGIWWQLCSDHSFIGDIRLNSFGCFQKWSVRERLQSVHESPSFEASDCSPNKDSRSLTAAFLYCNFFVGRDIKSWKQHNSSSMG